MYVNSLLLFGTLKRFCARSYKPALVLKVDMPAAKHFVPPLVLNVEMPAANIMVSHACLLMQVKQLLAIWHLERLLCMRVQASFGAECGDACSKQNGFSYLVCSCK